MGYHVSANFLRSEFACKCGCGFDTVDVLLIKTLEEIRECFSKIRGTDTPITITSGCRCPAHNKASGGSHRSQHLVGKAADFTVAGVPPEEVQYKLRMWYPSDFGVGHGRTFTHIDVRKQRADWNY